MPRKRDIKHEFFKAEEVARVSPLARLLFIGLWTIADRDGRLLDRPGRIKAEVLPYDQADVESLLGELARERFIVRYQVAGRPLIWIRTFSKHQSPHPAEKASELPAFTGTCEIAAALPLLSRGSQVPSNPLPSLPSLPSCSSTPPLLSSSDLPPGPPHGGKPSACDAIGVEGCDSVGDEVPSVAAVRAAHGRTPAAADGQDAGPDEPQAKRKRGTQLPDDFTLTAEREAYAVAGEVADPAETFAHFRDHHSAKGTVLKDWDAGWRTWVRNDRRFRRVAPAKSSASREERADAAMRGWLEREEGKRG